MRSIWNGTISFGLVNIPIKIYSATKENDLNLHFLHEEDLGRISNERVCKKCGRTLGWDDIVRGYEYQKGKYVVLTEQDLEKVSVEASKNITIMDFVDPEEIDPMYFEKPYYLAPDENSEKLYVLLREALKRTGKVGIAKFVFHDREHLAAIKSNGRALMIDIMHFADEIIEPKQLDLPASHAPVKDRELEMAEELIDKMTSRFDPDKYKDTYREDLLELINKKLEGKQIRTRPKRAEPTNVVDIMSRLKASIEKTEKQRQRA